MKTKQPPGPESPAPSERVFYEAQYQGDGYAGGPNPEVAQLIRGVVERFDLRDKRVLEVGCGRAWFQDTVRNWVGIDLAASAVREIHKPFVCASADRLPFCDGAFDAVWSIHVLEHVPRLEAALQEMTRVLRPGGILLLKPAWFCRPWAAQGYEVRPWRELTWGQRLIKASIPLRNNLWYRAVTVAPRRFLRELVHAVLRTPRPLHYRKLAPNYAVFWQADSDACNSIDPHDVILWFTERGWQALDRESLGQRLRVRTGPLLFRKPGG